MKRRNLLTKICAIALLIACFSAPVSAMAHRSWCKYLHWDESLWGKLIDHFSYTEKEVIEKTQTGSSSEHKCTKKLNRYCGVCGDLTSSKVLDTYTESHSYSGDWRYSGYLPSSHLEVYFKQCVCGHKIYTYETARTH